MAPAGLRPSEPSLWFSPTTALIREHLWDWKSGWLHGSQKDEAEIHVRQKTAHRRLPVNVMHMFVDDAASLSKALEAAGIKIIKHLVGKDYGQRVFVFADPGGNRIDIEEHLS